MSLVFGDLGLLGVTTDIPLLFIVVFVVVVIIVGDVNAGDFVVVIVFIIAVVAVVAVNEVPSAAERAPNFDCLLEDESIFDFPG